MNELERIGNSFDCSEPVFTITLSQNQTELIITEKKKYFPPDPTDKLFSLVRAEYSETLDVQAKRFVKDIDYAQAYRKLVEQVINFYLQASHLKNPNQTKTYKWLRTIHGKQYNDPSSIGFIGLFKYIESNELWGHKPHVNAHVRNVLAVLELMREKYDE